jgi:hypothetical protein
MGSELYLIAKAGRDWKNISQYQDERQQGRSTARNGRNVAGWGATGAGLAYGTTKVAPDQVGTVGGALTHIRDMRRAGKIRQATLREMGDDPFLAPIKTAARQSYKLAHRAELKHLATRFPGPAGMLASSGVVGVGGGMYAAGRTKARRAEANVARLRRQRAAAGR